jgi:hypothetical protein
MRLSFHVKIVRPTSCLSLGLVIVHPFFEEREDRSNNCYTLHDRYETFAQVRKRCIEDFAKNDETRVAASFVSSLSWMSLLAGGEFMWNVDE